MADPKLTSSILDLSRNVDKLISEIKKNTSSVQELVGTKEESPDISEKLGEVAEGIKNIDLGNISTEISNFSKDLKKLDFGSLTKKLGELDFKSLTTSLKSFDLSKFGEKVLGKGTGEKIGDQVKNVVSGTFKDLKKSILGGFESGGTVNKSGNYVVGERGPEVVKLKSGDKVVSNKDAMTDQLLKMALAEKSEKGAVAKKTPSPAEIESKRKELLAEDPDLANDPDELNYELKRFISRYGMETFTREDYAKLSIPVKPKEVAVPVEKKGEETKKEARERRKRERETPLQTSLGKIDTEEGGENKKTSGLKNITQNLGKQISGFIKKIGGRDEIIPLSESINKTIGLGLATKKSPISTAGDLLQPTLKTLLPKISSVPKITKEAGELVKNNLGIKKSQSLGESLIGDLSNKIGDLFKSSKKEEGESEKLITTATSTANAEENKNQSSQSITKNDLDEMKAALFRIASLLEGPISVAPLDYPFRPDSRRV